MDAWSNCVMALFSPAPGGRKQQESSFTWMPGNARNEKITGYAGGGISSALISSIERSEPPKKQLPDWPKERPTPFPAQMSDPFILLCASPPI
jgi:hypothetical protein